MEKYSSLYYPTRVAATVQLYLDGLGNKPTHAQILTTIKRITKEKWATEDKEIREAVNQALADDKQRKAMTVIPRDDKTPADYQQ